MPRDIPIEEVLRYQAWERAKGELRSMLRTYYPSYDTKGKKIPNGFEEMEKRIEDFVADVEGNI